MFSFFKNNKDNKKDNQIKKYPKCKIGLALGGGAARGLAHIGVIKAFEEAGISFDFVAGTSVGSLIGAFYCAGKTSSEMIDIVKNIKEKDIRTSKIIISPSKTEGLQNLVRNNLGDIDIEDLKIPFAPVAVDLKTTNEIAFRHGNLSKAVAGSCAVPGVFVPVEFEDKLLADGGLQNTVPADIPKLFGCDYVIAVDVNSSRSYGTESTKLLDVLFASIRILMKNIPTKGYNHSDFMITPDLKRFKSTKLEGYDEMIEEGYRCTKKAIPQILEIFAKKPLKRKAKLACEFAKDLNLISDNGTKKIIINDNIQQDVQELLENTDEN